MSELTRGEKVEKLYDECIVTKLFDLAKMEDQEINDLYSEHFEKITKEDFEGFEKVYSKMKGLYLTCKDNENGEFYFGLEEIKKELGL